MTALSERAPSDDIWASAACDIHKTMPPKIVRDGTSGKRAITQIETRLLALVDVGKDLGVDTHLITNELQRLSQITNFELRRDLDHR